MPRAAVTEHCDLDHRLVVVRRCQISKRWNRVPLGQKLQYVLRIWRGEPEVRTVPAMLKDVGRMRPFRLSL